ncbi:MULTISPECIES: hypothetical protein [Streptomyces]|uniref:hypothetical protein n=1 Tax=Streptomyces TaxID=1883 RepID=UPI00163CDA78|nr:MULTISPECIES: hypothetical protein [Streptomyces]MBC2875446.1 hypothetical protein [Streptomyces sp. TYQ1024]UBI35685.1 hypothetical protein K7I03_03885 [Streptomyces mobaraensis]UKW28279.1 hypothetical protein MCU78_03905 [Streptomyces sp. TYQ1024]
MSSTGAEPIEQGWDGPWYRVRTERFEASFLPDADEDLDAVSNVDVEVRLTSDGSRWSATVFTLAEVERLMARWSRTGEALGGRYFWCSDGLIVRDPGVDDITQVLAGLLDTGAFTRVLQRLDDE